VPWQATTLKPRGKRLHRIGGTRAKCEVTNLVRSATLEDVRLAMVERRDNLRDRLLGASGGRARTTVRKRRSLFKPALKILSEDSQ
jgi:hypothetical protein